MAPYSVLVSWLSQFRSNKLKVTLKTTLGNFITTDTSNLNIPNHSATTHMSASEFLSILLCTVTACPGTAWITHRPPQPCVPPMIIQHKMCCTTHYVNAHLSLSITAQFCSFCYHKNTHSALSHQRAQSVQYPHQIKNGTSEINPTPTALTSYLWL